MFNKRLAALLIISAMTISSVGAKTNFTYQKAQPVNNSQYTTQQPLTYNSNEPLKGSVVTVPSGATIPVTLQNELSSAESSVGDVVTMYLNDDFYYNDKLIAAAGSRVMGTVVQAKSAKFAGINGKLCVRFTEIITPLGSSIPISGVIKTNDGSGVLIGGTKMDVAMNYTKDLAAGSAAGALSGLVFGALASGDKLGRGTALGTAVGAGGGLIKSVASKGKNVTIPANAGIEIMLTQPITTAANYSFEN